MATKDYLVIRVKKVLFDSGPGGALHVDFGPIDDWIPRTLIRDFDRWGYGFGYSGPIAVESWKVRKKHWEQFVIDESRPPPPEPEEEEEPEFTVMGILKASGEIYRGKSQKYHPDLNPQAGDVMTDFNELWQSVRSDVKAAIKKFKEKLADGK